MVFRQTQGNRPAKSWRIGFCEQVEYYGISNVTGKLSADSNLRSIPKCSPPARQGLVSGSVQYDNSRFSIMNRSRQFGGGWKTIVMAGVALCQSQFFVLSLAIGTVGLGSPLLAEQPEEVLGVSQVKPAEGPFIDVDGVFMVPYTMTIPGSNLKIEMVPIPGGVFKLGSTPDSPGHQADEGPQVTIAVGPMWVAKHETTWAEYKLFMSMYRLFKSLAGKGKRVVNDENVVDSVTAPTNTAIADTAGSGAGHTSDLDAALGPSATAHKQHADNPSTDRAGQNRS
jgi:hypothetical protein